MCNIPNKNTEYMLKCGLFKIEFEQGYQVQNQNDHIT